MERDGCLTALNLLNKSDSKTVSLNLRMKKDSKHTFFSDDEKGHRISEQFTVLIFRKFSGFF